MTTASLLSLTMISRLIHRSCVQRHDNEGEFPKQQVAQHQLVWEVRQHLARLAEASRGEGRETQSSWFTIHHDR